MVCSNHETLLVQNFKNQHFSKCNIRIHMYNYSYYHGSVSVCMYIYVCMSLYTGMFLVLQDIQESHTCSLSSRILPQCKYHYWLYTSISNLVLMILCDGMPENCDHHLDIVHNVLFMCLITFYWQF